MASMVAWSVGARARSSHWPPRSRPAASKAVAAAGGEDVAAAGAGAGVEDPFGRNGDGQRQGVEVDAEGEVGVLNAVAVVDADHRSGGEVGDLADLQVTGPGVGQGGELERGTGRVLDGQGRLAAASDGGDRTDWSGWWRWWPGRRSAGRRRLRGPVQRRPQPRRRRLRRRRRGRRRRAAGVDGGLRRSAPAVRSAGWAGEVTARVFGFGFIGALPEGRGVGWVVCEVLTGQASAAATA